MAAAPTPTPTSGWYCTNFRSFTMAAVSTAWINRLARPRRWARARQWRTLASAKTSWMNCWRFPRAARPAAVLMWARAASSSSWSKDLVPVRALRPGPPACRNRIGRAHTKWSPVHLLAGGPVVVNTA
jgi:hypothetical protein